MHKKHKQKRTNSKNTQENRRHPNRMSNTSFGDARQPQEPSPSKGQTPHLSFRKESSKRGLRSHTAIAEKRRKRANQRRITRRWKRQQCGSLHSNPSNNGSQATAREPKIFKEKLELGAKATAATLNIRGLRSWCWRRGGKLEQIA